MWQTKPEREQKRSRWGFRGKTVWDWLPIVGALLIPVVIALGTGAITWRLATIENERAAAERELAEQRAQDEALQAYLDEMGQLMLERKLLEAKWGDPVHTLAQARTSTVILRLDAERNESVTRFLTDSGLAPSNWPFASSETSPKLLGSITLTHATLSGAHLPYAHLSGAVLIEADLSEAFLSEANLSGANLSGAVLGGANLTEADLNGAKLIASDLSEEQLRAAKSLEGATMPDGLTLRDEDDQTPHGPTFEEWLREHE